MNKKKNALLSVLSFPDLVKRNFGYYLTIKQSLRLHHHKIVELQVIASKLVNKSIEELDAASYIHGEGHPNDGRWLNILTQKEEKEYSALGGLYGQMALNHCLTSILNVSNEIFRLTGRKVLDSSLRNYLQDVWNRLTHHSHYPTRTKKIESIKLTYKNHTLPHFNERDEIHFNDENVFSIIEEIRLFLTQ